MNTTGKRLIETHPAARRLLARAFAHGKLAHAYLFAGPEGAGKRTLARQLAAALVCAERTFPACGRCEACRRVEAGKHPDVIELMPENIRTYAIVQVRDLIARLQIHSYEDGYKVVIIANADRLLREDAQNAFLKTLEEPPSNTALILTAANLPRLLPTIISRCQLLRLGPLPTAVVKQLMQAERNLPEEEAALVAEFASGNAVKALDLELDFVIKFRRELLRRVVELDGEDRIALLDLAEQVAQADYPTEAVLDLVGGFYHDVLYLKLGRDDIRNRDLLEAAAREARRLSLGRIVARIEMALEARRRALGNANPRINWEIMLMSLKGIEGAGLHPT